MHKDEIKLSTSLDLEHAQVMRVILTCFLAVVIFAPTVPVIPKM